MSSISLPVMQNYLSRSLNSFNQNKLNGILAEIDFRNYLAGLGFQNRISPGGWIVRSEGPGQFGHRTMAIFPHTIEPGVNYLLNGRRPNLNPNFGLHTICSTFHQIGVHSYFCSPAIAAVDDPSSIQWHSVQLGVPTQQPYTLFPQSVIGFNRRRRHYNFLTNNSDVAAIPAAAVPEEFSKEHLRVTFRTLFMAEISDVDGILWGNQYTYPIEIKEKTAGVESRIGDYFGLDVGPFVKLAFYAAKRGNLHSIFIVREIDNVLHRNLVQWWYITFDQLAQFASWVPKGGGTNMQGGGSTVVQIPKAEFQVLDAAAIQSL